MSGDDVLCSVMKAGLPGVPSLCFQVEKSRALISAASWSRVYGFVEIGPHGNSPSLLVTRALILPY